MKKLILSFVAVATIALTSLGQSPEGFKYQAVVRDAGNLVLNNQAVGMRLTIQQGSIGGTAVYTETFAITTNAFGLVNLEIGSGITSDDFTTIDWANGPYFMETAVDLAGGSSYTVMGTSQLMSVPYALHAKTADNVLNDLVNDADADPANEIQTISRVGTTVTLSSGGSFQDSVGVYTAGAGIDITNNVVSVTSPNVENLSMIQGTFDVTATVIYAGQGYTVVKNGVGDYTVTFNTAFTSYPAITYSTNFLPYTIVSNVLGVGSVSFLVMDSAGTLVDPNAWISFIAVGAQ